MILSHTLLVNNFKAEHVIESAFSFIRRSARFNFQNIYGFR
jgi:hypothetical protein